ncbi:hypothetical protein BDV97DRAFT_397000 [Delphinella strobiligena]|nr:hypothetical protein BDV97DRAFT_397000 [Delphinella strobiligena]
MHQEPLNKIHQSRLPAEFMNVMSEKLNQELDDIMIFATKPFFHDNFLSEDRYPFSGIEYSHSETGSSFGRAQPWRVWRLPSNVLQHRTRSAAKNVRVCDGDSSATFTHPKPRLQIAYGQRLWDLMDKLDNVDWLDEGTPPQQLYDFLLRRPDVEVTQTELADILYLISLVSGPFDLCHDPQMYWGQPSQDEAAIVKCEVIATRLLSLTMHHNPTLRPPISYLNSRQPELYFVNPVVVQDPTGQELADNKPHVLKYLKLSSRMYDELEPYAGILEDYKMVTAWARFLRPSKARIYNKTMRGFMHMARRKTALSGRRGRYLGPDGLILPSDNLSRVLFTAIQREKGETSMFRYYRPFHIMYAFVEYSPAKLVTPAELVEIMRAYNCKEEVATKFAEYVFELMHVALESGPLDLAQVAAALIQAEDNEVVDVARMPGLKRPTIDELKSFDKEVTEAVYRTMQVLADQIDISVMTQAATEVERRRVPPNPTTTRERFIDALRLNVDDPKLNMFN